MPVELRRHKSKNIRATRQKTQQRVYASSLPLKYYFDGTLLNYG
jgi:hypothetical protein